MNQTASPQKFVIELWEPETDCIANEHRVETDDVAGLCRLLSPGLTQIRPGERLALDEAAVARLAARFSLDIPSGPHGVFLRRARLLDQLSYPVHTNRELKLMLAGQKPLAAFSESHPARFGSVIPELLFAPHVERGEFTRFEFINDSGAADSTRHVLYSRPGQEWRIQAYLLLKQTAKKTGWNEALERMEGSLLGYLDEQNDEYVEKIYKPTRAKTA